MQTLILNHYPPVIKQIKEMQQIAKAEDVEFSKLNVSINQVIRNMFIFTADKSGIERYEHLFGITPKASQSLEERRMAVMFRTNQRKMSLAELKAILSEYLQGVEFFVDINKLKLNVSISVDAGDVGIIRNIVDEVLPLNICFVDGYHVGFMVPVCCKNAICIQTKFHPRANLPELSLDDTWILDGSQTLSGYDGFGQIDLYPVGIDLQTMVKVKPKEETGIVFTSKAKKSIRSGQEMGIKISAAVDKKIEESITVQASAAVNTGVGDIIVDNLNYLDDGWELDGSRELNGGIYQL